jgi:hypothetical protein
MHVSFFFPLVGLVSWIRLMTSYMELPPDVDPSRSTQLRWDSVRFSLILTGVLARFLCFRVHMQSYLGCVSNRPPLCDCALLHSFGPASCAWVHVPSPLPYPPPPPFSSMPVRACPSPCVFQLYGCQASPQPVR